MAVPEPADLLPSAPSRSVALPLPSSPHWAPSTTIAGIGKPSVMRLRTNKRRALSGQQHPGLLRWNATSLGHPAARYGREVEGILVVSNAGAGSAEEEAVGAALEVLRAMTDVRVAETSKPEELDDVLRDVGERSVVVAGGDGS